MEINLLHKVGVFALWLFAFTIVLTMTGCITTPVDDPQADHSFLTQEPCVAPCWYGLEPNKSTTSEILVTLNKLPFVDPITIGEFGSGRDDTRHISFTCSHPKNMGCAGTFSIVQGVLKRSTFYSPYRLTFQTVVDTLGPPDYFDYGSFGYPEPTNCYITLQWPTKGVYLWNDPDNSECTKIRESGHVSPDMIVNLITYTSRLTLPLESESNGQPWLGFAK